MTKRDVAVWFCRVIGLIGIATALFGVLGQLILFFSLGGLGAFGFSLPQLALHVFVYLFASSIGTELAAEGEYGLPVASKTELNGLLWRCFGLGLLIYATGSGTVAILQLVISHFSSRPLSPAPLMSFYTKSAIFSLAESAIGFALAFGPRVRLAMQSK